MAWSSPIIATSAFLLYAGNILVLALSAWMLPQHRGARVLSGVDDTCVCGFEELRSNVLKDLIVGRYTDFPT